MDGMGGVDGVGWVDEMMGVVGDLVREGGGGLGGGRDFWGGLGRWEWWDGRDV